MVIWNGESFREKGIIVENIPVISKGKKRINKYQIDGRNGFIAIDEETYDSFVVSICLFFLYSHIFFAIFLEYFSSPYL